MIRLYGNLIGYNNSRNAYKSLVRTTPKAKSLTMVKRKLAALDHDKILAGQLAEFKREIENRYHASIINHTYKYKRTVIHNAVYEDYNSQDTSPVSIYDALLNVKRIRPSESCSNVRENYRLITSLHSRAKIIKFSDKKSRNVSKNASQLLKSCDIARHPLPALYDNCMNHMKVKYKLLKLISLNHRHKQHISLNNTNIICQLNASHNKYI